MKASLPLEMKNGKTQPLNGTAKFMMDRPNCIRPFQVNFIRSRQMQSSIPIPTDNIYKFSCLFGLALIVSGVFSFVTSYNSSLDRKVKYMEAIIPLEAKPERTKVEEDFLIMNHQLIALTKDNEKTNIAAISILLAAGLLLSTYGAVKWKNIVQKRDDQLAELQLRKLSAEVEKLESQVNKPEIPLA
jgi:hypothetical protein